MTLRAACVLFLSLAAIGSAGAQDIPRGSPPLVKYGKWGLLAASVTMNLMARNAHIQADDEFAVVSETCAVDRALCATLPDGRYADPVLEQHYQRSLNYDSRARRWLVGGQTALVGAAVGFIWELARARNRRKNIPFEPEVSERDGATRMGFRIAF